MKTYTLKSAIRRGSMFAAAVVVAGASLLPFASSASADALNPLTDRSLTLSSSAPGWDFKDGSGNTTYAAPNSGANGKQTGNTFSFKVSTDTTAAGTGTPVKAMTFQYCTDAAGDCMAPGNNGYSEGSPATHDAVRQTNDEGYANATKTSDLEVVTASPSELGSFAGHVDDATGAITDIPTGAGNNYVVYWLDSSDHNGGAEGYENGTWKQSTGWSMTASVKQTKADGSGNQVDGVEADGTSTGKKNYITLTNSGAGLGIPAGAQVKVVFFGTETNYITNPGSGAFFVKINTYSDVAATTIIDGGVTVANVMNLGISIQTKVLETMDFSVGTVDPYTLSTAQLTAATSGSRTTHGTCDPILNAMLPTDQKNTLLLGSETGEHSLDTDTTYSTHSYFRLSSNASAGATVYYSGVTLSNTVGDRIAPMGTKAVPSKGTEQFGLALANNSGDSTNPDPDYKVNYSTERKPGFVYESGADNTAAGLVALNETGTPGATGVDTTWTPTGGQKLPQLTVYSGTPKVALTPLPDYNLGAGVVNATVDTTDPDNPVDIYTGDSAQFKFDDSSNLIPVPIASESDRVVDCASAKVRYIANIAATTPAGIYTTKINFIAAPQY